MLQVTAPASLEAPSWVSGATRRDFVFPSGLPGPTGSSPQSLGRPKAEAYASSPSPETPDPVAAPTAGFAVGAWCSIKAAPGSVLFSLSRTIAFRTVQSSVPRNSSNFGLSCAPLFVATVVWHVSTWRKSCFLELL